MVIAFWSNANEKCPVTANMAAISVASVIRYPYSVVMMENHLGRSNLRTAFYGRESIHFMNEAGTNYYDGNGMEGLVRKIYRGDATKHDLAAYIKQIVPDRLYYIPKGKAIHNKIFDYEFEYGIEHLLKMMEGYADVSLIGTASHYSMSTKTILEKADLIVVNLCQKQSILDDFFLNYSSLIPKAVFLISNYEYHTKLSVKKISQTYELPLENLIAIPKNELFQVAYMNGGVKDFIDYYSDCGKESPNFLFMHAIRKATYLILKRAVEAERNKGLPEEMLHMLQEDKKGGEGFPPGRIYCASV